MRVATGLWDIWRAGRFDNGSATSEEGIVRTHGESGNAPKNEEVRKIFGGV